VWLGLGQLHTLRGVSLVEVPAADIAAALPRLHTLHLNHRDRGDDDDDDDDDDEQPPVKFPVAPFFNELLPRLRSFHLTGAWPETTDDGTDGTKTAYLLPLPRLEDFKWQSGSPIPRGFIGARPSTLDIDDQALNEWWKAVEGDFGSPFARMRALTLLVGFKLPVFTARLLREAPQLRHLRLNLLECWHAGSILTDDPLYKPIFMGLRHQKLRHLVVSGEFSQVLQIEADFTAPFDCGVELRQRHFPRLRRVTVDDDEYPVWVEDEEGDEEEESAELF
jgi:hypothetical protein